MIDPSKNYKIIRIDNELYINIDDNYVSYKKSQFFDTQIPIIFDDTSNKCMYTGLFYKGLYYNSGELIKYKIYKNKSINKKKYEKFIGTFIDGQREKGKIYNEKNNMIYDNCLFEKDIMINYTKNTYNKYCTLIKQEIISKSKYIRSKSWYSSGNLCIFHDYNNGNLCKVTFYSDSPNKIRKEYISLSEHKNSITEEGRKIKLNYGKCIIYKTLINPNINICNKNIVITRSIHDHKLHGLYAVRNIVGEDEKILICCCFRYGLLNGKCKTYYDSGKKFKSIKYKNGIKNGCSKWYDIDGHIEHKIKYENGLLSGSYVSNYDSEFQHNGITTKRHMNIECLYSKGIKNSIYSVKKGNVHIIYPYKLGVLCGKYKKYKCYKYDALSNENTYNIKSVKHYLDNKLYGVCKKYDCHNIIKLYCTYFKNKIVGYYYESPHETCIKNEITEGYYVNGERKGLFITDNLNDHTRTENIYDNDKIVSSKIIDIQGINEPLYHGPSKIKNKEFDLCLMLQKSINDVNNFSIRSNNKQNETEELKIFNPSVNIKKDVPDTQLDNTKKDVSDTQLDNTKKDVPDTQLDNTKKDVSSNYVFAKNIDINDGKIHVENVYLETDIDLKLFSDIIELLISSNNNKIKNYGIEMTKKYIISKDMKSLNINFLDSDFFNKTKNK